MTDNPGLEQLSLSETLIRWTDPHLVANIRTEERRQPAASLHQFYRTMKTWVQILPNDDIGKGSGSGWAGPPDIGGLLSAWKALDRDIRQRIERGEFHLSGVRVAPIRDTTRSIIESIWAADFEFDFHLGRIKIEETTYVAIVANRGRSPEPVNTFRGPPSSTLPGQARQQITPETVRALSDDEVLVLLEEHARRVVENAHYKALDPGITNVTFMPLILRKMRARAAAGELHDTVRSEAAALEEWIQLKVPSHQVPTAGAIENSLRNEYRSLKA